MATCITSTFRAVSCRETETSLQLKLIVAATIIVASIFSISSPLILSHFLHFKPIYAKVLLVVKCFSVGVILSTSLVHVYPIAFDALSDCQLATRMQWKDFPFVGVVPMIGVVVALFADVFASSKENDKWSHYALVGTHEDVSDTSLGKKIVMTRFEMGITGWHDRQAEEMAKLKQRLVAEVLEIGTVFHPMIMGLIIGMARNQCIFKPLVASLVLYQMFEGIALGSCMAQVDLSFGTATYMCFAFSSTAPIGTVLGIIVLSATHYQNKSPNALIMEGITGSLACGILLYTTLVKFTAVDFFHGKLMMASQPLMKKLCYIALLVGCASMSVLVLKV